MSFAESAHTISPVEVLIARASTATSIRCERVLKDGSPPKPGTLAPEFVTPNSVIAPTMRYSTPSSFPTFTAVLGSTSPESERFFSCISACSFSRSTTRNASPLTRAVTIMSCDAWPTLYQL